MCIVSAVGDYWKDRTLPQKYPGVPWDYVTPANMTNYITRVEFEQLKRDVEEIKKLLEAAKRYDEQVGEPHCESEDKIQLIRKIAKLVGVDLADVV